MAIGANMTKREQMWGGIGVAAIAVLALYWYFLYKPKAAELTATEIHVDSLEKKNQQAKADIATGSLQKLRAQSAEYEQSLKVMRQLVPRSNEVPALLEDISTAARRVGSLNRIIAPVTMAIKLHPIADKTKARLKKGESLVDTEFQVQTYVVRTVPYAPLSTVKQ